MHKKRLFLSLILTAVLLAACSAGTSTSPAAEQPVGEPSATSQPAEPATEVVIPATSVATEPAAATVVPVVTSRGPALHATDPTTVKLDSGGLQLVEFFRFT